MAVNEVDWLKHQMSGKQYWTVIADYITFPVGERSYPFPKFEGAQAFAERSAASPHITNVRIKQPNGGEIRVDSTHKHVISWYQVGGQAYKRTDSCPNNDCNDC
jgi:hypothetical protein